MNKPKPNTKPYHRPTAAAAWRMAAMAATTVALIGVGGCAGDTEPTPTAATALMDRDVTPAQHAARAVRRFNDALLARDIDAVMDMVLQPGDPALLEELRTHYADYAKLLHEQHAALEVVAQQTSGNWAAVVVYLRGTEHGKPVQGLPLMFLYSPTAGDPDAGEATWWVSKSFTWSDSAIDPLVNPRRIDALWRWYEANRDRLAAAHMR